MPSEEEVIANILIGEAVGDGPEGMMMVRDVGVTRSRAQKKSLYEILTAPKQFSAYGRKDLSEFAAKQPLILRNLALELAREGMRPDYQPTYNAPNYVTTELHQRRHEPTVPSWIREMDVVGTVGRHTLLAPRKRKK